MEVRVEYLVEKNQMGDEKPLWYPVAVMESRGLAFALMGDLIDQADQVSINDPPPDFRVVKTILLREVIED